jgi:hypothetical protein
MSTTNRPGSETSWVRRAPLWAIGFLVTWQRMVWRPSASARCGAAPPSPRRPRGRTGRRRGRARRSSACRCRRTPPPCPAARSAPCRGRCCRGSGRRRRRARHVVLDEVAALEHGDLGGLGAARARHEVAADGPALALAPRRRSSVASSSSTGSSSVSTASTGVAPRPPPIRLPPPLPRRPVRLAPASRRLELAPAPLPRAAVGPRRQGLTAVAVPGLGAVRTGRATAPARGACRRSGACVRTRAPTRPLSRPERWAPAGRRDCDRRRRTAPGTGGGPLGAVAAASRTTAAAVGFAVAAGPSAVAVRRGSVGGCRWASLRSAGGAVIGSGGPFS